MAIKRPNAEEIVMKLQQVDVLMGQGRLGSMAGPSGAVCCCSNISGGFNGINQRLAALLRL